MGWTYCSWPTQRQFLSYRTNSTTWNRDGSTYVDVLVSLVIRRSNSLYTLIPCFPPQHVCYMVHFAAEIWGGALEWGYAILIILYTSLFLHPNSGSLIPKLRSAFHRLQYRKAGRAWYLFSHEYDIIVKWPKFQKEQAPFRVLCNQLHVQLSVCMTVTPC